MTIMQIEKDGKEYTVIHYKFAISNPNARLYKEEEIYYAEIEGNHYVLGYAWMDGNHQGVAEALDETIQNQTTKQEKK